MSRRKIKRKVHKKRPRGRDVQIYNNRLDVDILNERSQRYFQDDEEMKRIIGNGLVDMTKHHDAKYISQVAHDLGWNQTRFKKSLMRVSQQKQRTG